jgi:uncharacterized protein (TIGR02118 family)
MVVASQPLPSLSMADPSVRTLDEVLPPSVAPHYPIRSGVASVVTLQVDSLDDTLLERVFGSARIEAYEVEERLQWDYERTWPLGEVTPGVKQVSFLRRLDGLTPPAFADHWVNAHAPLAARHHPTIWRYVQNVVVQRLTPDAPGLDGIAELTFRSFEDWRDRKYDSPEGQAIIAADIARFIDRQTLTHVLARERVMRAV